MQILAIETSCDETSVAIVEDGQHVRALSIASASNEFSKKGGVIPEDAARKQVELMLPTVHAALKQASADMNSIDAIAVTKGPGLLGSLLVGTTCARTLALVHHKPLIGVHHTLGHLSSTFIEQELPEDSFPLLTLSVSGGHTELWLRRSHTDGTLLGRTRDDAAGEAFDKGAALLDLPYPGGPSIAKAAELGNEEAYEFPLPLRDDAGFDFSFSGLKTALRYLLRDHPPQDDREHANIAASYQYAIVRHLLTQTQRAVEAHNECAQVHIVGGVSANTRLREWAQAMMPDKRIVVPSSFDYCTDNAAMIGAAAYFIQQEQGTNAYDDFETAASMPMNV